MEGSGNKEEVMSIFQTLTKSRFFLSAHVLFLSADYLFLSACYLAPSVFAGLFLLAVVALFLSPWHPGACAGLSLFL